MRTREKTCRASSAVARSRARGRARPSQTVAGSIARGGEQRGPEGRGRPGSRTRRNARTCGWPSADLDARGRIEVAEGASRARVAGSSGWSRRARSRLPPSSPDDPGPDQDGTQATGPSACPIGRRAEGEVASRARTSLRGHSVRQARRCALGRPCPAVSGPLELGVSMPAEPCPIPPRSEARYRSAEMRSDSRSVWSSKPLRPIRPAPGDPRDAHVEFEPESDHRGARGGDRASSATVRSGWVRPTSCCGDRPQGRCRWRSTPRSTWPRASGRNREAWAPVLLEMAGIPTLGSDALTLSLIPRQGLGESLGRGRRGFRWRPRRPDGGGAEARERRAAGALSALREAALGRHRQGDSARTSRVDSRADAGPGGRAHRSRLRPARARRGLRARRRVHGHPRRQRAAARAAGRPARSRAETRIGLHALEGPGAASSGVALEPITAGVLDARARSATGRARRSRLRRCSSVATSRASISASMRQGEPVFLEINPLPTFATGRHLRHSRGARGLLARRDARPLRERRSRAARSRAAAGDPPSVATSGSGGGTRDERGLRSRVAAWRPEAQVAWPSNRVAAPPKGVSAGLERLELADAPSHPRRREACASGSTRRRTKRRRSRRSPRASVS